MRLPQAIALLVLATISACQPSSSGHEDGPPSTASATGLARVFSGLALTDPVTLAFPAHGHRLYVAERAGTIKAFDPAQPTDSEVILDLGDRIAAATPQDGLIGLAFHPRFDRNGQFFVHYTAGTPSRSVVARCDVNEGLGEVMIEVPQPFDGQRGGQLAFGPDGHLYVGVGDGGGLGDPMNYSRNRMALQGKILRIDVDAAGMRHPYAIPLGSPFLGARHAREEVFASGFRDPRTFSFDPLTGRLWATDSGQDRFEEVNLVAAGEDYGWDRLEAAWCREGPCGEGESRAPLHAYDRKEGAAIAGGRVYRGSRHPGLVGAYVFADGRSGRVWALREGTGAKLIARTGLSFVEVASDREGELLFLTASGALYRLDAGTSIPDR